MYKQHDKPHWIGTLTAFLVAVGITALVTSALHLRATAAEVEVKVPMPVATVRYEEETAYERDQRFLGLIQAANRSQIGFEVAGSISDIYVKEGDIVAKGDPLAKLDTKARRAQRDAALANRDRVSAELELARARTARQAPLIETGAISAQTYDDTRLAEKALESALAAANAELAVLDIAIEKSALIAPFSARVGRQLVDQGTVVAAGTPMFALVETGTREAHIGVAVEQAVRLETGSSHDVVWRNKRVEGVLRTVRPDVNTASMTTTAIFEIPAAATAFDGEAVAISLKRLEPETGGWLPVSSLLEGERGVWTVLTLDYSGDAAVTQKEVVEVLHVQGDQAYVRGSLVNGDRVIADGVHRIAPGVAVTELGVDQIGGVF